MPVEVRDGRSIGLLEYDRLSEKAGASTEPPGLGPTLVASGRRIIMWPMSDEPAKSDAYYKVERQVRERFPEAMKAQRSGVSVDLRLYFREKSGHARWGGLALLAPDGTIIENMPLADEASLPWLLEVICELGFEAAPQHRTKPLED